MWVNFSEIREKVSISTVLIDYYGLTNLKTDGDKLVGPCPVHQGDSPRAFHADLKRNIWHCFSRCQRGGNVLDLVSLKDGVTIRESALRLQARYLSGQPISGNARAGPVPVGVTTEGGPVKPVLTTTDSSSERVRAGPPEPYARNPPLDIELTLRHDHPHLSDVRKLSVKTCTHFGVGFCSHGTLRGTIAIPIHDEDGVLVAYAGRRLKPEDIRTLGKYKFPKGFRKELVLYNLHAAREPGRSQGLVLVEGFFAVLYLFEAGIEHVVAAMGCELSERQVELLSSFPEVVLLFDGDEPGRAATTTARAKLTERTLVRVIHLPGGVKPDDLSARALRWLVNGVQLLDLSEITYQPRGKPF